MDYSPRVYRRRKRAIKKALIGTELVYSGGRARGDAIVKTRLTPTVQYSFNQVIRDRMLLGDALMALFAFPCSLMNVRYLLKNSGHDCLTYARYLVRSFFNTAVRIGSDAFNASVAVLFQQSPRILAPSAQVPMSRSGRTEQYGDRKNDAVRPLFHQRLRDRRS